MKNLSYNGIYGQVQLEPTTHWTLLQRNAYGPSKYTGMLQATKDIFREEGLPVFVYYEYIYVIMFPNYLLISSIHI